MDNSLDSTITLLNSLNHGDRIKGLNQLRTMDKAEAFRLILPLVKDMNTRVRYAAVSQLDALGRENLELTLELLRDRLHNDSEPDVQAAAADAIGGLQLTEAYDDLEKVYHQTTEWLVQFSIIATLGELGEPRGFELLEEALHSDNNLLQTAAIGSFGELGDSRAVELLISFADNEDWQIRYRLAQALGRLGGEQAQVILQKLANDQAEQVAQEAKNNLSH